MESQIDFTYGIVGARAIIVIPLIVEGRIVGETAVNATVAVRLPRVPGGVRERDAYGRAGLPDNRCAAVFVNDSLPARVERQRTVCIGRTCCAVNTLKSAMQDSNLIPIKQSGTGENQSQSSDDYYLTEILDCDCFHRIPATLGVLDSKHASTIYPQNGK